MFTYCGLYSSKLTMDPALPGVLRLVTPDLLKYNSFFLTKITKVLSSSNMPDLTSQMTQLRILFTIYLTFDF